MKKIYFLLVLIGIVFFFFIIINIKNFDIRININSKNMAAIEINNKISINVEQKLLSLNEIKDIYIFSKNDNCNIYIILKPYYKFFKKTQAIQKIKTEILNSYFETDDISINFEDDYNKPYNYFIVNCNNDYIYLDNITDGIFKDILSKKIASKALKLYDTTSTVYINYLNSSLLKFDLSIEDIKNLIKENNFYSAADNDNYTIESSSFIKNINDIKNINIFYKNNSFSSSFKDVFNVVESTNQNPNYLIFFNNQNASIVAINKLPFKKISYNNAYLLKTSKYDKITIILDKNSKIDFKIAKTINEIFEKEKIKDTLFFIGIDSPKTSLKDDFFETDRNKLTIFINKKYKKRALDILKKDNYVVENGDLEEILDKNLKFLDERLQSLNYDYINPTTYKQASIFYELNNAILNNYYLDKKTVTNSIISNNEGLFCNYYYKNHRKIPIIIKNNENRIFVYSKHFKTLLPLDGPFKKEIRYDYYSILRKNGYYLARIYSLK